MLGEKAEGAMSSSSAMEKANKCPRDKHGTNRSFHLIASQNNSIRTQPSNASPKYQASSLSLA
jgi:hypothetical protein